VNKNEIKSLLGDIIIKQERSEIAHQPAPPLVIRQQPPRPETPAPLVIREMVL
jgi:hypothetical protein